MTAEAAKTAERDAWQRFALLFAGCAALAAAAAVGWTLYFDVLWVFRTEPPWLARTGGANHMLDLEMRRAKALHILGRDARVVILGSSVLYRGVDPANARDGERVYNAGISSLMSEELPVAARLITANQGAEHAVFGLDFFMFCDFPAAPPPLRPSLGTAVGRAEHVLGAVLGGRILLSSNIWRVAQVLESGAWHRNGFRTSPDRPPDLTRKIDAEQDHGRYIPAKLDHLDRALTILAPRRVTIYLSPMSRAAERRYEQLGVLPQLLQWRKDVAALASRRGVPLLDLSAAGEPELFDPQSGSSEFWFDNMHFKPVIGRRVLDSLGLAPGAE
jgi:hypothetical protein